MEANDQYKGKECYESSEGACKNAPIIVYTVQDAGYGARP